MVQMTVRMVTLQHRAGKGKKRALADNEGGYHDPLQVRLGLRELRDVQRADRGPPGQGTASVAADRLWKRAVRQVLDLLRRLPRAS